MRKYEAMWELLKRNRELTLAIDSKNIFKEDGTPIISTMDIAFDKIKRAVQKEKYMDIHFKAKYPKALLSSNPDYTNGRITFMLDIKNLDDMLGVTL